MTPVELLNLALLKIGVSKGIAAITDETREAWTGALVHDHMLRAALRRFPWAFATKYLDLTLTQGPAWTGALVQAWDAGEVYAIGDVVTVASVVYYAIQAGSNHLTSDTAFWSTTATTEANGDWLYAYRWPEDCIFARRIVFPGTQRKYNPEPVVFRVGRDANGRLIYSNQQDAELEYTMIDCAHLWPDDLFIDFFTWVLAASLAPSLSSIDKMQDKCLAMAQALLDIASTTDMREQQQEKPGDADWILGR